MKRTHVVAGLQGGEYTYTSELNKMREEQKAEGRTINEIFGYFLPSNVHNGSEDRTVYDKVHIKHCAFGRDIMHCIEARNFNPWSIMERFPPA